MATRTIVTSQPDVACDVCERRLLRGEQADAFLATGRRLMVCELCAPRAVHEGWLRESEEQSLSLPPQRPRRGRSLLERLPVPFRMRALARQGAQPAGAPGRPRAEPDPADSPPYDFLERDPGAAAPVPAARAAGAPAAAEASAGEPIASSAPPSALDLALEAFNESEYPRRVAGVARSLGAPEVSVRSAEHAASVVRILVAWELCWYRYEVDLDEPEAGARVAAQGTELAELSREERSDNAAADDCGVLSLSPDHTGT